MVVKLQNMKILLLLIMLHNMKEISDIPCDQMLMKTFKLTGLPRASLDDKLHICRTVENNCCTLIDELSITKYWNEYSAPRLRQFVDGLMSLYSNIFNYQKYISMVDFKHVAVHITKNKWIKYRKRYCSMHENVADFKHFDAKQELYEVKKKNKAKNQYKEDLNTLNPKIFNNIDDSRFLGMQKSKKKAKRRLKNKVSRKLDFDKIVEFFNGNQKKALEMQKKMEEKKRKAREAEKKRLEEERKKYLERKEKAISKLAKMLAKKTVKNAKEARKIYKNKFLKFLKDSKQDMPKIKKGHRKRIEKFLADGKIYIEDMPKQILAQAKEFHDFMKKLKKLVLMGIDIEAEALKTVKLPDVDKDIVKIITDWMNKKNYPSEILPQIPDISRSLPKYPSIRSSRIVCTRKVRRFYKYFLLMNSVKYRFCYKAYTNLSKVNEIDMSIYISKLRNEATSMLNTKRSLYCGICDGSLQKFFNHEKDIVYYSADFCRNFINTYMDYIKFNNVIFIEYADEVLQYFSCISTPGSEMEVPFKNIFHKMKQRIAFFKRCFNNVNRKGFMKHCHFICSKYNINGIHQYIEGDVHHAYILYLRILEFVRKYKLPFDNKIKINLEMIENLKHFFYQKTEKPASSSRNLTLGSESGEKERGLAHNTKEDIKIRQNIINKANKKENKKGQQIKGNQPHNKIRFRLPIYRRVPKLVHMEKLEPIFLKENQGFDPLAMYAGTDFNIDKKQFILKHFYKDGYNMLTKDVMSSFFSIKSDEVYDFNSDVYIQVEDYDSVENRNPELLSDYITETLPNGLHPTYGNNTHVASENHRADDEFKIIN